MRGKVLTLHTCNVRGLSTKYDKLQFYYKELRPLGVYILTETNLSETKLTSSPDHTPPPHIVVQTTRDPTRGEGTGSGVTFVLDAQLVAGQENVFYKELLAGYLSRVLFVREGNTYLIYGVYCPPAQLETAREILNLLYEDIANTPHTHLIVGGDINAALRKADRLHKATGNAHQQDKMWQEFMSFFELTDIVAYRNPLEPVYTYTTAESKSAIDHILVSEVPRRECVQGEVRVGKWRVGDHYAVHSEFRLGAKEVPSSEPTVFRVPATELANQDLEIQLHRIIQEHYADPTTPKDKMKSWLLLKQKLIACIVSFTWEKDRKENKQLQKLQTRLKEVRDKIPSTPQQAQNLYRVEQRLNKAII
jgi:exonuclease III